MSILLNPLESAVTRLFDISIISDVLNTSTSASSFSTITTARSVQTVSSTMSSPSSRTTTSASKPSSFQTSSGIAKTSEIKNDPTTTSVSSTLLSTSISTSTSSSSIDTSSTTSSPASSLTTDASTTSDAETVQSLSSVSSASTTPTTLSTSITMAPTPQSTIPSANTVVNPKSEAQAGNGPQSHVAAIVVASVMGAFIFATIMYLIFRYCPPVRNRWEAYQDKKNGTGAYHDTVGTTGSPSSGKQLNRNRRSFLARNWYWNGTQGPAEGEDPGTGLGLGPVSTLREQALMDTSDRPPPRVYAMRHSQIGRAVG